MLMVLGGLEEGVGQLLFVGRFVLLMWGELSYGYGRVVLGRVLCRVSYLWGELSVIRISVLTCSHIYILHCMYMSICL